MKYTNGIALLLGAFIGIKSAHAQVDLDFTRTEKTYQTKNYKTKFSKGYVRQGEQDFVQSTDHVSFLTAASLPASYSLRGKAGPVEDQGKCGSCWDFALTTALRGTWMTEGEDKGRLSFNYLLNCAKGPINRGCKGGGFGAARLFKAPRGAPAYGSDGIYTESKSECVSAKPVASTADYHMLGFLGNFPSYKDIAYVVGVLHRPVVINIAANDDFDHYAGGVYNACSANSIFNINHMVVIEGYDCEKSVDVHGNCKFDGSGNLPNGVGTWTIRNSWGEDWGDNGYVTMKATAKNGKRCNAAATTALYYQLN